MRACVRQRWRNSTIAKAALFGSIDRGLVAGREEAPTIHDLPCIKLQPKEGVQYRTTPLFWTTLHLNTHARLVTCSTVLRLTLPSSQQ